jgi:hypothetical protein
MAGASPIETARNIFPQAVVALAKVAIVSKAYYANGR